MAFSLLGLSVEIILLIILELDAPSIIACKRVRLFSLCHLLSVHWPPDMKKKCCRHLKSIIEDSAAAQFRLGTALCGYEYTPPSRGEHLSLAARRKIFKAHRDAWSEFNWTATPIYKCTATTIHNTNASPTDSFTRDDPYNLFFSLSSLSGGILASTSYRSLQFFDPLSVEHGTLMPLLYKHEDIGVNCRLFSFDRGLDLLLLVEEIEVE